MGIKLLHGKCIACNGKATRVFMAFQARICGKCCRRLLVSDVELAWTSGIDHSSPPYIVRYIGSTRVLFFMRQHLRLRSHVRLTREGIFAIMQRWPGVGRNEIRRLIDQMG
jgi:hypothetical protein